MAPGEDNGLHELIYTWQFTSRCLRCFWSTTKLEPLFRDI